MIRTTLLSALAAIGLSTGAAFGAGGAGHVTDYRFSFEGPFGSFDQAQLQRGFQVYKEVCSACHGLKHVARLRTPRPASTVPPLRRITFRNRCLKMHPT